MSDSKKELITKLGADEYINSKNEDDMKKLQQAKIDVMLNTTSLSDLDCYMDGLKKGTGCLVQLGVPHGEFKINAIKLLMNEWRIAGSAASNRSNFEEMLNFCSEKKVISKNEYFDFEDYQKAYDTVKNGKPEFRVVVIMKDVDTSMCKGE